MNKAYTRINWENYPSDATPLNEQNLNKVDSAVDVLDDRIIVHEVTKATKAEVAPLVQDITFDEPTGIFTVLKKNGSVLKIDTQIEKIAVNFNYNRVTQMLELMLIDGTTQYIDLAALITEFEFLDSDTIAFSVDSVGEVTAIVKEGSIEGKHLQPNYLADIKVEVAKVQASATSAATSEANAKASEANAKASEANAKASEANAKTSEANAKASATSAATSEANAKASEANAKASETSAATSETNAKASEANAKASATSAATSETNAKASEAAAAQKASEALGFAVEAESWAHGTTNTRTDEDIDNARYYYEQAKKISQNLNGIVPMGTIAFEDLPTSGMDYGWMYNISDDFTSDERFNDGGGIYYGAGNNVIWTSESKWDVLASSGVTGIKGDSETYYRQGNVNITPSNIGALSLNGDSKDNTVSFSSSDSTAATSWTNVSTLVTGEKHSSIFAKLSMMFKNIRYLYNLLGTTSIASIGGGTVTGAISSLNSNLVKMETDTNTNISAINAIVSNKITASTPNRLNELGYDTTYGCPFVKIDGSTHTFPLTTYYVGNNSTRNFTIQRLNIIVKDGTYQLKVNWLADGSSYTSLFPASSTTKN